MKIFIPSKGRSKIISTHKYLGEEDYAILLHNKAEKRAYLKNSTIRPETLIVTDMPFNLPMQRNFVKDHLVKKNIWYMMMDDNIHGFHRVPRKLYKDENLPIMTGKLRKLFDANVGSFNHIDAQVFETISIAQMMGVGFVGFAKSANYFFRRDKWKTVTIICHKMCCILNDELRYDHRIHNLQDKHYTALNLIKYGKVLMNNYIYPIAGHNEAGGLGTLEERIEKKIKGAAILMKEYPGLFHYFQYKGCPPKSDIRIRLHNEEQIKKWKETICTE